MSHARLAIVSTHPIQYYAPLFKRLSQSSQVQCRVFFTWSQSGAGTVRDPGFDRSIRWDIPLLEGYEFEFVRNIAARPGTHHFWGTRNPGLNSAIEKWGAQAVLVFGWSLASHLSALRYFKGRIPVLFRGDSTLLNPRSRWRKLARQAFLRWVYGHIDVAMAVGSNNRDYYRWCGVPADRVAFAPHAVDSARFSDLNGEHEERAARWRSELRIPDTARTLLYAGKFIPEKDSMLLLEAFLDSAADAHLVLVGNGPLEPELRARARGCRNIHFLPFQNQQAMPAVYRLGQVFALTSRSETWGLALNEAMASGRPVIASDRVGGARDLIEANVTGWTFESGNRRQLAEVIRTAMRQEPAQLKKMGDAALELIGRWSIAAAADGIERAVLELTGRRQQPWNLELTRN